MNNIETYSFLFSDTLFGNIIFYGHGEMVLPIMSSLETYNRELMLILASLGFLGAILVNYIFGKALYKVYKSALDESRQVNYELVHDIFNKYGSYLLCLSFLPITCWVVPLLSGFLSFSLWRSLFFAGLARVLYYVYMVYV